MSITQLPDRELILSSLSDDLKEAYRRYCPQYLTPAAAAKSDHIGATAIITGIPKYVDAKTEFSGFMMFPIVAGNVTTFMMIPIMDEYDVYEISDPQSDETFLLAHARCEQKLDEVQTRVGGFLKEWQVDEQGESEKRLFLETNYYTPLINQ
jgi:hypothetical protein